MQTHTYLIYVSVHVRFSEGKNDSNNLNANNSDNNNNNEEEEEEEGQADSWPLDTRPMAGGHGSEVYFC